MGADSLAENTPNVPQIYLPNLSAQDQKFGISKEKKASLGVRSPWFQTWSVFESLNRRKPNRKFQSGDISNTIYGHSKAARGR